MKMMKTTIALVAALLLFPAASLLGQGTPITGTAGVSLSGPATLPAPGGTVTYDVNVNLTGMTGTCNGTVPLVLAQYTIPVGFTPAVLQFASSAACTSAEFGAPLATTPAATANANGFVVINDAQANSGAPAGNVCVARLTFNVVGVQQTLLTPNPGGLAPGLDLTSAFQNCAGGGTGGPATIPATSAPFTIAGGETVQTVPAADSVALSLLGLALAAGGWLLLRARS